MAGATSFPALSAACTTLPGSTAGATGTSGIAPPPCGVYPNSNDVWYTATSSATGTLALDVDHVSASNLAMSVYSVSGACPTPTLTHITCNADIAGGVFDPFISLSGLTPNALHYIRIWPEGNAGNGGTFTLCAYHPVPPPNDQPCGATVLNMANPTCVPMSFNTQDATPLSGVTVSGACAFAGANDVWFRLTVPAPGGIVNVNTLAGSLNFMGMAIYTGACGGPLTQVECQTPTTLPAITTSLSYPTGTTLYVRVWNFNNNFGTAQICAFMSQPPPNDDPCGAISLSVPFGCLMTNISNNLATNTSPNLYGANTVPNPSCMVGAPYSDIWFRAVVPANGQLAIDMDDGQMTNAAYAIYTATGACPGTLSLTQVPGANGCKNFGSTNPGAGQMPAGTTTGLTPGSTVYIRVWRESTLNGTASICAGRTDTPPVNPGVSCYFTLRMLDSGGDGWNGSYVTVTVGGVPTNYTINSGTGTISFPVLQGQAFTISYTAVGGFQNQISYSVITNQGSLIYSSPPGAPATGLNMAGAADCNLPPGDPADCSGAFQLCTGGSLNDTPSNSGAVNDLNSSNDGCLAGEHQGVWYTFASQSAGWLYFTITPPAYADYDFAVWGPYTSYPTCVNGPTSPPVRCSWAAGSGPTGLNNTAFDPTEGAGGDRWVQRLYMNANDYVILFVDNWSRNGVDFNLQFPQPGGGGPFADISCTLLPVVMQDLSAELMDRHVDVNWKTSQERNTSHFIVERSSNGRTFEPIGRVDGTGNGVGLSDYKFTDVAPKPGVNYYRLQVIDQDGSSELTQMVSVMYIKGGIPMYVYPNPATETLQAAFDAQNSGTVRWRVLDTSGRVVDSGSESGNVGTNRITVPVSSLDAGSYLLEILDEESIPMGNARFVKQ